MIHITEISKSFGTQVILDRASLHIRPAMRIGLVGPNGAGKTTLLRILANEMSLDEGDINARKDLRIGFLPQEIEEIAEQVVLDEVLTSYADILDMEHRLKDLGDRIAAAYGGASTEDADTLMRELGALQTAFEHAHGYALESRAQAILRGMGFRDDDFQRSISELSGGWRMRVALARLLMESPDLLLLDEPTNHLDLESLLWLEEFLLEWPGSLVIVSHDRYFLNRMVTHIVELDRGVMDLYAGSYDHYEVEKQQRYEALANAAKNQQREIESAESFVRRFRAKNTKAKQVQQKIRQLEKMERIDAPVLERKKIKFRFPQPGRTGRVVVEAKHARKAYGDTVVYKDLNLVVERGDKIALVGPNGAGKSTLLKLLAGVITPDGGSLELGHNVRCEYFAQHQLEVLSPDRTVLKTMEEVAAPADKLLMVRGYLGTFLFTGDEVDKKVGVLSGGEKARLALARMLLDPAGLLLLDEPTNHLDMASRGVLTEALRQFEGSVVFISHDRHLINAMATKVIEVKAGRLTHYLGDWEYYQWKSGRAGAVAPTARLGSRNEAAGKAESTSGRESERSGAGNGARSAETTARTAQKSAVEVVAAPTPKPGVGSPSFRERREVQKQHRQVEKRILALEARQQELGALLADPAHSSNHELLMAASEEASAVKDELAALYPEWELLTETVAAWG